MKANENRIPFSLFRIPYANLIVGFCLLTAFFSTFQGFTQTNEFRLSIPGAGQGLIVYKPRGIVQDSFGFIWIGGERNSGLLRYDGKTFDVFDSHSRDNYVRGIPEEIHLTRNPYELVFLLTNQMFLFNILDHNVHEILFPEIKTGKPLKPITALTDTKGNLWCLAGSLPDVPQKKIKKPESEKNRIGKGKQGKGKQGKGKKGKGRQGKPTQEKKATETPNPQIQYLFKSTDYKRFELVYTFDDPSEALRDFPKLSYGHGDLFVNLSHTILQFNPDGKIVGRYPFKEGSIGGHAIDENGIIWFVSDCSEPNAQACGIYFWDKKTAKFSKFPVDKPELVRQARNISLEQERILIWGFCFAVVDRKTGQVTDLTDQFVQTGKNNRTNSKTFFYQPFKDRSGLYWVPGTINLFTLEMHPATVRHFPAKGMDTGNTGKAVKGITEGEDGTIYFAVAREGLYRWDQNTGTIGLLPPGLQISGKNQFRSLTYHRGYLFVDNVKMNLQTGTQEILQSGQAMSCMHALTPEGDLLIKPQGPEHSLFIHNLQSGTNTVIPGVNSSGMIIPKKSKSGYWVNNFNEGLILFDNKFRKIKKFSFDRNNENSLPSNRIYCGAEDAAGNLWLGSDRGLSKLDPQTETFTHYTMQDGLPSRRVFSMLVEPDRGIWLGTGYGLSWFDFATGSFFNFTKEHGIDKQEFNQASCFRATSGKLYFGGLNGIDAFFPDDLLKPPFPNALPFRVMGYSYFDGNQEKIISKTVGWDNLPAIRLGPKDKLFKLQFRLMDNRAGANTLYSYKLEGYDKDWSRPTSSDFLQYENTPPGSYTLRIKASLGPTAWNAEELSIRVIKGQFWYKTGWAYAGFFLLALGIFWGFRKYELARIKTKNEKKRLEELNEVKTKLYTNITHEFRTPITVIQGMAGQLEGETEAKRLILRNSKNLLHLVNQLLDMSKIEHGKMDLKLVRRDIIAYLRYLTESFQSYAITKKTDLAFHSETEERVMNYDPEKVQHILANLLSNAIKFTQEGGAVSVRVSELPETGKTANRPVLQIQVRDNGMGIEADKLPHIFDRFFQVDNTNTRGSGGTGIGLSLAKELVELMEGSISVESGWSEGTTFTVLLPIDDSPATSPLPEEVPASTSPVPAPVELGDSPEQAPVQSKDAPLLLIIEDNADVVAYLKSILQQQYNIEVAYDGQQGIDRALEIIPDLIISDVMMPQKDGFEVTDFLKNDDRTSHIPIVLLTAKADAASRLQGLKRGADVYLAKPFDKLELFVQLENLLALRRKLQARYSNPIPPKPSADIALQLEDAFLQKVRDAVHENIDDADFGVSELCKSLYISQSQLYRKINALTGKSIAAHVRSIRLYRGYEMLQTGQYSVSEVAYEVGFTDPNYFSKTFHSEFGFPPSEMLK